MSKKWTQSEFRGGRSVSPKLFNDELRAQQSSMTTLDRAQMPVASVGASLVAQNALHQVWYEVQAGTHGEQQNEVDPNVPQHAWQSSSIPTAIGGWRTLKSTTLTGFKGGNLFVEWSCNAYANNIFAYGTQDGLPGSPNYIGLRILVNGVNIAERRGAGLHRASRIFGAQLFPPGDLTLTLQWTCSAPSEDAAEQTTTGDVVPLAHIWNNRWIAIARYR